MRLRKITLENYRIHKQSTLNIGDSRFIIVRGPNGGGKSSFADGLSVNLTGTTVSLPGDGKGYAAKIAQGEKKATVTAEIQGQHTLQSVLTLTLGAAGRDRKVTCLDAPEDSKIVNNFEGFLADKKPALLIATQTEYFGKLDEEKQTNLIAKLVLPARYNFPTDKIQATEDVLGKGIIDFDANPFDVIGKAYKLTYKERESVNRLVRDFVVPDRLEAPKGVDSASLQTQLTTIREKRGNLQKERDAAVAKANEGEVERGKLETKIVGLRADADRQKKSLADLDAKILTAADEKKFKDIAAKAEELSKLKEFHAGLRTTLQVSSVQISRLKEIAENGATCPTCDSEIDAGKIAGLIAELEKEYAETDRKIQECDKKIEAFGDVQGAIEALKKHEAASKERSEAEKALLDTVKIGKETKAKIEALPPKVDATAPFTEPLAKLQTEEDAINAQLRPVIAAEERAKDIEAKTKTLDKLKAKAALVDTLVKYYDTDGVKAELIGSYIGGFEAKLFSVLDAWGFKCSLKLDPFDFQVTTRRGYTGPVKELSGAEEHIFKYAFQCAVSIAAGIKFVVVDEVELLGQDIRNALYSRLFAMIQEGTLEQAIIIGFSLDKTLPKPQAPGSKYFYISDGTVEELR